MEWLSFDPEQMAGAFNSLAFMFAHVLHKSPLFELPKLAGLAEYLERRGGRRDVYNAAAGREFAQPFAANGAREWTARRAIEDIERSGSWMVLKRIEQHPEYNELVQACLGEVAQVVPAFEPWRVKQAEGFIFVTSPHGVTPYHIDPQWSFLAQIRGRKTYRIYDVLDPEIISNEEIEDYYCGQTMAARYAPEKDRKVGVFDLLPGQAVNQPLHAPHSAQVGDEYSVSFTVAVISDAWGWQGGTHRANRWLRKHGLTPAPVGRHRLADRLKSAVYGASLSARTRARQYWNPTMFSRH